MIDLKTITPYHQFTHDKLQAFANTCTQCQLSNHRSNVVFCSGNPHSNLMLIGEGPGQSEDETGIPFVGRSGQLLTQLLTSVGINRDDIYIANTVKCRPPNNRTPTPAEMNACNHYLIRQIQLVQPKILVLLGAASLRDILGQQYKITQSRGQWFRLNVDYMDDQLNVMPIFHPSYLLRFSSTKEGSPKWLTIEDFKEVQAALSFYDIIHDT